MKHLAVFDFDHTIINDNSDTAIIDLIGKTNVPKHIRDLHKNDGWTAFMQGIFELFHEKQISQSAITAHIENLAPVDGMPALIKHLKTDKNCDVIILSDSNSYFIEKWLEKQELTNHITRVFTNPADFDENGLLKISMHHFQDTCKLSTKNLCKGQIMEEFITSQNIEHGIVYDKVIYCGDGVNDFCPIIRLKETDLACVRNEFKCIDLIKKSQRGEIFDQSKQTHNVKAEVLVWNNGNDILQKVNEII